MIVKICGLTSLEDALIAADSGADMLGFNYYTKSPRYITPSASQLITSTFRKRHPNVTLVGVFVNSETAEIHSILDTCGLDLAQLSGDETPAGLIALGNHGFKALRPASAVNLQQSLGIYPLRKHAPVFLIDAYRAGEYGGTGKIADWTLASQVSANHPILLAGGLTPENVVSAIQQVRPWGVDVASGVEISPGVKDLKKMAAFIRNAKTALPENPTGI